MLANVLESPEAIPFQKPELSLGAVVSFVNISSVGILAPLFSLSALRFRNRLEDSV